MFTDPWGLDEEEKIPDPPANGGINIGEIIVEAVRPIQTQEQLAEAKKEAAWEEHNIIIENTNNYLKSRGIEPKVYPQPYPRETSSNSNVNNNNEAQANTLVMPEIWLIPIVGPVIIPFLLEGLLISPIAFSGDSSPTQMEALKNQTKTNQQPLNNSGNAQNPPPPDDPDKDKNNKKTKDFKTNDFKKGDDIGIDRFTRKIKGQTAFEDPNTGQRIVKDFGKHGQTTREQWKLLDRFGKRMGTVDGNGIWFKP